MTEPGSHSRIKGATARTVLRVVIVLVLALVIHRLLNWASAEAEHGASGLRPWMLAVLLLSYAVLLAIPFVPGVEIGLTLMAIEGPWITPWVYLATSGGMTLAYVAGDRLSYPQLHRILADMSLRKACSLIERLQPLNKAERLDLLRTRVPLWARPFVSRFRYVLMAALINLPGNSVIGGGGGLMFLAGFSRLFQTPAMVLTIALSVAPVPLAVWLFEVDLRSLF